MGSSMNRDICVGCLFVFDFENLFFYEENVSSWREVYENSTRSYLVIILADSLYTVARTLYDECHHNLQMLKKPSFLF